jgi:hypothetical protein
MDSLENGGDVKRMGWMRVILVAALAIGCKSEKTTASAAAAATGNGQPQGAATQGASQGIAAQDGVTQAGPGGVEWTTMRDGREQAFSIQVPKGWNVNGGLFRYRIAYPRPTVDMTSPDGKTTVMVGDATIPNYQTPVSYRMPGGQQGPPVEPYASGDVYAGKYGLARFKSMCQSVELKGSEPEQPKFSKSNGYVQSTAGQATFSCTLNGEPMTGYVYAETMLVKGMYLQPSNWYVMALGSYLAPAGQAQQAGDILEHAGTTIKYNPEWTAFQNWITSQGTKILITIANITKQNTEAMDEHQKQWSKMMAGETDDFNDILTGTTFVQNNATGQTYEVATGQGGQKWMNSQQTVVTSAMQPGGDFVPLTAISHQ